MPLIDNRYYVQVVNSSLFLIFNQHLEEVHLGALGTLESLDSLPDNDSRDDHELQPRVCSEWAGGTLPTVDKMENINHSSLNG